MVVCSLCKRDGHLKKDCPEDFKKVKLNPLPPVTPEFLSVLDEVCEQCYSEYGLNVLKAPTSTLMKCNIRCLKYQFRVSVTKNKRHVLILIYLLFFLNSLTGFM